VDTSEPDCAWLLTGGPSRSEPGDAAGQPARQRYAGVFDSDAKDATPSMAVATAARNVNAICQGAAS
jgi:hypothetical protein